MKTRKLMAWLLTLCMALSLLPLAEMTAMAESNEDDGGGDTSIVVVTPDEDQPIVVDPEDGNVQVDVELPEDFQIIVTMDYPWHGGGTARNPFLIEDAEDLQLLAEGVQQLEGVAKARYRLTNDIDLSSVCGPEVGNWLPIGSDDHPFRGVLDGAGHKISGLYITGSGSGHALFGTSCGYVLNLTVDGTVSGSKYAAGIVAKNCSLLGGCVFQGTVSGINENSSGIGGIAGINGSVVLGCRNDGVVSTGCEMGGVVGCNWGGRLCLCTNKGTVKNSAQERVGGVAGITGYNTRVAYCYNYGTFENISIPGGIAGEVYNGRVENCVNYTAVSGTRSAGGIAGRIVEGGVVVYCKNYAAVGAKSTVGGICAELVNGSVEDCINSVPVSGETYVGGIAGFSGGTVSGCVNTGEITASVGRVGGIIGRGYNAGTIGCCNLGDVTCTETSNAKVDSKYGKAGGIIGESLDSSTSACLNGGTISANIEAGGIAGELWGGEALRCQNHGTVKPYAKRQSFGYGGIVGCADHSTVEDCRNDGTIKGWREKDGAVEYNDPAGGIVGLLMGAAMRNTVNYGSPGDRWGRAEKNSKGESCTKENNYKREGNDKSKYSGLDFEEVWVMTDNGPRPRNVGHLAHDGVVKISSVDELRLFRDKVNHGVDFGGVTVLLTKDLNLANEDDWLPIGHTTRTPSMEDPMAYFDDPVFAGVFDGGGHRIRGLKCTQSDRNGAGLFGKVTGKVCNLQVIGSVTGHVWVGGVVGVLHGGTVTNCSFEGNVTGQYDVGGVVGLCDWYENLAQVTKSLFQGNVTATGAIEGRGAGGIIGRLSGGVAEQCAVLGGTVSSAKNAGGVVGYMEMGGGWSMASNCSHLGDVNGTFGTGGVVGTMKEASVLFCCYHYTGNVTGSQYVGGVVGMAATGDDSASPDHCYYLSGTATVGDKTTGGIGALTKGLDVPDVAQALTKAQFRYESSFSAWKFRTTWIMGDDCPVLKEISGTVTFFANGGGGSMGAYTLPSGGGALPKCSFTAPGGMEFIGWNTSPRANGDWYEDGADIGGRQTLQLYAVWAKRQNVQYVDTTYGDAVETAVCLTLHNKLAQLREGWYCVEGDVQLGTRLEIVGDVNLILMDGASLTVEKGIRVPNDSTLTIWGQEGMHEVHEKTSALLPAQTPTLTLTRGTGKLTVSNQSSDDDTAKNAAIGGNYGESTGLIRINGGVVSAHASGHGAPIGGARCEGGGSIIISGGCVDAVSTGGGAGIGGGTNGSGGSVTISGGYVNAVGGSLSIVDQNNLFRTMKAPGIGAGAPDHLDGKGAKTAGPVVNISGAYVRADAGSRLMEPNPVKAQPIGTSYSTSYNTDWITSIGVEVYADGEKILHDGLGEAVDACDVLEFRPCEGHICCNDDPNHCRWCNARIAAIRGRGTAEEPWELTNTAQWDLLAAYMRSGFDLDSKYIDLMNDILVTTRLGTRENLFGGYFYGNGHTIVFALDGKPQAHDPFVCASTWGPSNTNIVVIKPGGAVIGYNAKDGGLNAAISLPEGYDGSAVLVLAEYDNSNRCTDVRTFPVTADTPIVSTGVPPQQNRTYKLMLVDAKTHAPLCAAWNT